MTKQRTESPTEEFDKALRSFQNGERRYRQGLGSISTAATIGAARAKMERLLPLVDDRRRAKFQKATS